jgi:hypothetical protein
MESFVQGTRLGRDDLNIQFYGPQVVSRLWAELGGIRAAFGLEPEYYPVTPWWIRYGLGYVTPQDLVYHEFGVRYRLPDEISTGVLRPNFIIGSDWLTGTYRVLWKYMMYEDSDIEFRWVDFTVVSAGIDSGVHQFKDYVDLPAEYVITI